VEDDPVRLSPTSFLAATLVLSASCSQHAPDEGAAPQPEVVVTDASVIVERRVDVAGGPVVVLEAGPADGPDLLLLHGAAFRAETWRELGTLALAAARGLHVVAVDLPGFGDTPRSELGRTRFLGALILALELDRPTLVSPSMSGGFTLPVLLESPELLGGWVAVAPAGVSEPPPGLASLDLPTLVVWGSEDSVFPLEQGRRLAEIIPSAELLILEGAKHPCYLDQPELFHERVLAFALER
jgi:abhydrolase domain-containing protein 14